MRLLVFDQRSLSLIRRVADGVDLLEGGRYSPSPTARRAAVLVPLCNREGIASVLFTVRTQKVSTHKGQASSRGHINAGEDAVAAALRETREEIGDSVGPIDVLGTCGRVPAATGTVVMPVIGYLENDVGDLSQLQLSDDEVDSAFTVSVADLIDPQRREVDMLGPRGDMPAFTGGPERIWGLTAFIIDGLLRSTIMPALRPPT
ncbi:unnamed protein product [Phaeothamnion confervicola]